MAAIDGLPPLGDVISRHSLRATKSLGQNFLLDLNLTAKIARSAGDLSEVSVLEIGPGPGGLTRALLADGAKRVVAVEKDRRCLPALKEIADHYPGRLEVIEGDALELDHNNLIDGPSKIIANLPYNIATPLLTGWLSADPWPPWYQSMTLMFQKEVARRICAKVGDKAYGRLSVLANWRCECEIQFDIAPSAFVPPPKVISSVVHLVPRTRPFEGERRKLEIVTRAAFGQRRKMLRASLKGIGGPGGKLLLEKAEIDGTRRAEELSPEEFIRLANCL